MKLIDDKQLRKLVARACAIPNLQEKFKNYNQKYSERITFDIPANILNKAEKINQKLASSPGGPVSQRDSQAPMEGFFCGELKIFGWVVLVYCELSARSFEDLNNQNFEEIHSIFPNKSILFIRFTILHFNIRKVKSKNKKNRAWGKDEQEMLVRIIGNKSGIKWRATSFELFCESEGTYFRNYQECREKWNNYLDPKVNRGTWTDEEDLMLLMEAEAADFNWSQVSQEMRCVRTQHMIKNRYRSLLNHYKKLYAEKSDKKTISKAIKEIQHRIKVKPEETLKMQQPKKPKTKVTSQEVKLEEAQKQKEIVENSKDKMVQEPFLQKQSEDEKKCEMILIDSDRLNSWMPSKMVTVETASNIMESILALEEDDEIAKHQRRTSDEEDLDQWLVQFQEEREEKKHEWFDDEYAPFQDF